MCKPDRHDYPFSALSRFVTSAVLPRAESDLFASTKDNQCSGQRIGADCAALVALRCNPLPRSEVSTQKRFATHARDIDAEFFLPQPRAIEVSSLPGRSDRQFHDMTTHTRTALGAHIRSAQIVLPCSDLAASLAFYTERLGFRVDLIFPADSPTVAVISGHGLALRLETGIDAASTHASLRLRLLCDNAALSADIQQHLVAPDGVRIELVDADAALELPEATQEFVLSRMNGANAWNLGRAGMQYRDLIPSRLGGRFVASHIRIPDGGEVPDYVHFHNVRFQMIYCKSGWVRAVYEDQGPPFVLNAGDCVLQPPGIRHRVLESSPGLEVIEIGCPAVHETFADHDLALPTQPHLPERVFAGQRFVRHVAAEAEFHPWTSVGFEMRDTGIAAATSGLAGVRVVRTAMPSAPASAAATNSRDTHTGAHAGEFLFYFILNGELSLRSDALGNHRLSSGDSCVIPAGADYALQAGPGLEMLEVTLPAELPRPSASTR